MVPAVALTLADAGDVYAVALGEYVSLEYVTQVVGRHIVKAEFLQVLLYSLASLLQVAERGLLSLRSATSAKPSCTAL